MHYIERGSGTPILMIHGFCMDHHLLLGLDPVLAATALWRRIYIDLPGMGNSVAGSKIDGAPAVADAVVAFVRENFGNEQFAIIGNSFGGMVARHLVAEFGEQVLGLALLCPVAVAISEERTVPPKSVLRTDPELLASLDPKDAQDYADMAVIQSVGNWNRFRKAVLPGLRAFDPAAIERISNRYSLQVEPESRFGTFDGPALFITGRQDHVVGYMDQIALSKHYPRSSIVVLDQAGHNAHLDQPELVSTLLGEWLDRVKSWNMGLESGE